MTSPHQSDGGCLSLFSSCLKKRDKPRPENSNSPKQAIVLPSSAPEVGEPQVLSPVTGRQSAPVHSDPAASPTAESCIQSPTRIEGEGGPTPLPSASDQVSVPKVESSTPINLWKNAYDAVDEVTQRWIENNTPDGDDKEPIYELVGLVRSSEEKHKEEALKLKVGDREIFWRDYANRVVSGLITIGDIAIPFAPAPSPVVWSAVKVLLTANVAQCKDLVSIMGCTDIVLCIVRRGRVYEEVYIREQPKSNAQEDLKEKLVNAYKTCLEFLAFVDKELKQGNLSRFFDALVDPSQGEQRVSDVKALEQQLDLAANACGAEVSLKQNKLLESLKGPLKRIDDRVQELFRNVEKDERKKTMEFISTIPVGSHQRDKRDNIVEGACKWLIENRHFRQWEDLSCSSILWLQGNIGTGKSFLSSKVIERYWIDDQAIDQSNHDEGFAFFYCSRSDPDRQMIRPILQSYIRQLSEIPRRSGGIHKASYELFNKNKDRVQNYIDLDQCKLTLLELVNSYPRTTLVLDALDECETDTRRQLVGHFRDLIENSTRPLKIFVASRKQADIERHFGLFQGPQRLIQLSTLDNKGDIEKYVDKALPEFLLDWEQAKKGLKDHVRDTLVKKSDGISVEERLEELPATLQEAYDEIYLHPTLRGSERVMLQRAVRWVMCARTPLDSPTLLSAIIAESERADGNTPITRSDLTNLELVCRHLVTRDSELGTWKFPHASVAEYFEEIDEAWVKDAKVEITTFMINCMADCCSNPPPVWPSIHAENKDAWAVVDIEEWFETGKAQLDDTLDPRHPLQRDIHLNWLHHIHELSNQDTKVQYVTQALIRFWGENPQQPSKEYHVFVKYIMASQWKYYAHRRNWISRSSHSAYGVVAFGLHEVLDGWWDKDLDASLHPKLLQIAATFGYTKACTNLIRRGCNINGDARLVQECALGASIANENIDITRLLIAEGADPNLVVGGHSLLCLAVGTGTEYAQILLEAGTNPNIRCTPGSEFSRRCPFVCALIRAAHGGSLDALKSLIAKAANVNPEDLGDQYGSPLAAAVCQGHLDCAAFLIEESANVNAVLECGEYGSALAAAASAGHLDCVRLLVKHGANTNASLRFGQFGSPLAAAVSCAQLDCARFLMEHGAGMNSYLEFGDYGSILAAAILGRRHSLDMIKFLMEEKNANSTQLGFVRPRRLENQRLSRMRGRSFLPQRDILIAEYLLQKPGITDDILISIGFLSKAMARRLIERIAEEQVSRLVE